jgi:hypothetical protein
LVHLGRHPLASCRVAGADAEPEQRGLRVEAVERGHGVELARGLVRQAGESRRASMTKLHVAWSGCTPARCMWSTVRRTW